MHQAIDPAQVDEHAERGDAAHLALDLLSDLQAAEELVALLAALLVEGHLLGQDEAVGLAVDLEDLQAEGAADKGLQLLGDLLGGVARLLVTRSAGEVDDLADRDKPSHSEVDDQATLVVVDHLRLDDLARVEALLHCAPLALEAGPTQRKDRMSLRGLRLEDVDENLVAHLQLGPLLVPAVSRTAAADQLTVADDSLALAAEVDQDLVRIDADDGALDHVAVLEALHLVVGIVEQLRHRHRLFGGDGAVQVGSLRLGGRLLHRGGRFRRSRVFGTGRLLGSCGLIGRHWLVGDGDSDATGLVARRFSSGRGGSVTLHDGVVARAGGRIGRLHVLERLELRGAGLGLGRPRRLLIGLVGQVWFTLLLNQSPCSKNALRARASTRALQIAAWSSTRTTGCSSEHSAGSTRARAHGYVIVLQQSRRSIAYARNGA